MGSTRYIASMGELSRKDNSLCFRKNGKNVYIPVEDTKEIYCLNEVTINSKLLDFLSLTILYYISLIIMEDIVEHFIQEINIIVEDF